MLYEIKLADGDIVTYESDKTLSEILKLISMNDFIELPRMGYSNSASYNTKSIVYVCRDKVLEDYNERNDPIIAKSKPYVDEINNYVINKRMKLWLILHTWNGLDAEVLPYYSIEKLKQIIKYCEKYKCKRKER